MTKIRKLTPSGLGGSSLTAASSRGTTRAIPSSLRSRAIALFLVLASPPMLHGALVGNLEVISQSYQISGGWNEYYGYFDPRSFTGGYSLSSSDGTPLAASTTGPYGGIGASGSVSQFSLENQAFAPADDFGINSSFARATAQGVWDFRPADDLLQLNLAISGRYDLWPNEMAGGLSVELTDMTTSTTLLDLADPTFGQPYDGGFAASPSYTFGVNPSDVYEFSIYASGGGGDYDESRENITASIVSYGPPNFPDGGLTLGMLGMGVSVLAFMRRKLQVGGSLPEEGGVGSCVASGFHPQAK